MCMWEGEKQRKSSKAQRKQNSAISFSNPSEICILLRKKEDFSSVIDRLMAEPPITLGRATGERCASLCGLSYRAWMRAQPEAGGLMRCWSLMRNREKKI